MKRTIQLSATTLAVLIAMAGSAQAGIVLRETGLTNPDQTIDFDSPNVDPMDAFPIGSTFAPLVTFSAGAIFFEDIVVYPNLANQFLSNFTDSAVNPFFITFSTPQSAASFAIVTQDGTTTFTAFLGGSTVATSVPLATSTTSPNNFVVFEGIGAFDSIELIVNTDSGALFLDDLKFSAADAILPVPEASSIVAWGMVAFGVTMGAIRQRRRQQVGAAS